MRVHRAVGTSPRPRVYPVPSGRPSERRDRPVGMQRTSNVTCASRRGIPRLQDPRHCQGHISPIGCWGWICSMCQLPENGKQTVPVLNILDWGTNYQMCEVLSGKSPNEVWEAYMSTWARTFGHPEVITCDAGREFLGEFIQRAASEGIVIHQIASKAPWQQGKTERHGGHFKELLEKVRSEVVIQSTRDLKQIMVEVEQAKNRYSNTDLASHRFNGRSDNGPGLPTSIMSDEAVDPTLLNGVITDDSREAAPHADHRTQGLLRAQCQEHVPEASPTSSSTRVGGLQGRRVRVCVPGAPNEEEEAWRPSRR